MDRNSNGKRKGRIIETASKRPQRKAVREPFLRRNDPVGIRENRDKLLRKTVREPFIDRPYFNCLHRTMHHLRGTAQVWKSKAQEAGRVPLLSLIKREGMLQETGTKYFLKTVREPFLRFNGPIGVQENRDEGLRKTVREPFFDRRYFELLCRKMRRLRTNAIAREWNSKAQKAGRAPFFNLGKQGGMLKATGTMYSSKTVQEPFLQRNVPMGRRKSGAKD